MDVVLDLDLDLFVTPRALMRSKGTRLDEAEFAVDSRHAVTDFLEQGCRLSETKPIFGREVENHDDAFFVLRNWVQLGILQAPFALVHADAHADLGMAGGGYSFFIETFMNRAFSERLDPPRGVQAMNAGNYLLFLLATGWVSSLTYVHRQSQGSEKFPDGSLIPNDLIPQLFREHRFETSQLQLGAYTDVVTWLQGGDVTPVALDAPIDFAACHKDEFRARVSPTHMVVAKSPEFTPASADPLLELLSHYYRTP